MNLNIYVMKKVISEFTDWKLTCMCVFVSAYA